VVREPGTYSYDDADEFTPQNAPNVEDLSNRLAKMLSNSKCTDFIKDLLNGTSTSHGRLDYETGSHGPRHHRAE
jgi:hypothetical protein